MNIPEGFVLVPADPIKAIDMGWAYLDAAREAEPGKNWSFSHAGYRAMIAAAPLPVESTCRNDGRCEYAIQSGAEGNGHCPNGKCAMPQPAAHLTIPGALEWDQLPGHVEIEYPEYSEQGMGCGLEDRGITDRYEAMRYGYDEALDQFARILDGYGPLYTRADTHGVVGTHGADGESALLAAAGEHVEEHLSKQIDILTINLNSVRAQLANTEQSRRSFFDLSQDLEKRLAERDVAIKEFIRINGMSVQNSSANNKALLALAAIVEPAKCESCGGWGHIETEDSAHDCPECGPSVVERAVEAGVMNPPSKTKTCIECDQPYCHGVCVERGDQDYDRDQAAKGGDQ